MTILKTAVFAENPKDTGLIEIPYYDEQEDILYKFIMLYKKSIAEKLEFSKEAFIQELLRQTKEAENEQ